VGPQNPGYRGTQDANRGTGWYRLAASIRKRDGYICRRCRRTQVENGKSLDVDHIKPWRSFENKADANDPSNLASLCRRCHCHKTTSIEAKWLRGDVLAMQQYERAIALP
jgi:5-methylcytosine-specific restriction endonuclease McrA